MEKWYQRSKDKQGYLTSLFKSKPTDEQRNNENISDYQDIITGLKGYLSKNILRYIAGDIAKDEGREYPEKELYQHQNVLSGSMLFYEYVSNLKPGNITRENPYEVLTKALKNLSDLEKDLKENHDFSEKNQTVLDSNRNIMLSYGALETKSGISIGYIIDTFMPLTIALRKIDRNISRLRDKGEELLATQTDNDDELDVIPVFGQIKRDMERTRNAIVDYAHNKIKLENVNSMINQIETTIQREPNRQVLNRARGLLATDQTKTNTLLQESLTRLKVARDEVEKIVNKKQEAQPSPEQTSPSM